MTSMLHRFPDENAGFEERSAAGAARLRDPLEAAATTLAENYVGFVWEDR